MATPMAKAMNELTMVVTMAVEALHYLSFSPCSKEVTGRMVGSQFRICLKEKDRNMQTCKEEREEGVKIGVHVHTRVFVTFHFH
ncbi:hypothetical protein TorRG33x02_115680 [Trema orientale]|uniref:Uncharacterized protein n=1 Tax=Trema orientale TaxID=63057 RepID=A0A2P5F4I6_TREOI|nr:hypothetical protein TorRG33x02_115680 [Trema orientale]